jgi:hypothetical protein
MNLAAHGRLQASIGEHVPAVQGGERLVREGGASHCRSLQSTANKGEGGQDKKSRTLPLFSHNGSSIFGTKPTFTGNMCGDVPISILVM